MRRSTLSVEKTRELTTLALIAALLIALQVALVALPNIELVTLLVILSTVCLGWKVLLCLAVFIVVEGLIYGFTMWWINYLYVWPILVVIVMALRKWSHPVLWTAVSGIYGLIFGTLCSIPYFLIGGWAAGVSYIVAGIPYDITHCIGNTVLGALLFYPLEKVFRRCLAAPSACPVSSPPTT